MIHPTAIVDEGAEIHESPMTSVVLFVGSTSIELSMRTLPEASGKLSWNRR